MFLRIITKRWVQVIFLLALLGAAWVVREQDPALVTNLRQITFDAYNRYQPRPVGAEAPTRIIDIDEASLARYGQWPWPRTVVGDLVSRLKELGARVIVFDITFAEPDRTSPAAFAERLPKTPEMAPAAELLKGLPDNDAIFAQRIAEAGNVVTGITTGSNEGPHPFPPSRHLCGGWAGVIDKSTLFSGINFTINLPQLTAAAAGNGNFSVVPDNDGIIREVPLLVGRLELEESAQKRKNKEKSSPASEDPDDYKLVTAYPTLALEALRLDIGDPETCFDLGVNPILRKEKIIVVGGKIGSVTIRRPKKNPNGYATTEPAFIIPTNDQGMMRVYYAGQRKNIYTPAWEVLEKKVKAEDIKGKIVFIGTSASGLLDLRSTPLNPVLPGVEIHAEMTEQILAGQFLQRPHGGFRYEMMPAMAISVAVIFLVYIINTAVLALIVGLLVAGAVLGSLLMYQQGFLLDPVYPSLTVVGIFIMASILANLRSEMEKRMIRQAFDRYLSPDLIEELVKHPEKLKLGGEVRELTVMFTDIRNFTTISESMDPAELIRMMNDFLTPMTSAVLDNKGFVDKYMGDAMMTFWNAPVDMPEHAKSACQAALEMVAALKPVNDVLKARAEAAGRPFHELRAGIGINSGKASVGNMGSKQRFAYSALGDTVNLASRLEGQTKGYGISTMISSSTREQASEFAVIELDLLTVKGRTEPERIYGLLGGAEVAKSAAFSGFAAKHEQMLAAYRDMRWGEALTLAGECAEARPDLEQLYKLYRDRVNAYKQTPPPAGWTGVWVAKDK